MNCFLGNNNEECELMLMYMGFLLRAIGINLKQCRGADEVLGMRDSL